DMMKIVILSGSIVGNKTRTAMEYIEKAGIDKNPDKEVTALDLADYDLQFSDGRPYHEYDGATRYVTATIMDAAAISIGSPISRASITVTLKNIFDLLPVNAFMDKVVSMFVTAGSAKHYLVIEQQLKPILSYMKAHIVPTYVFMEEEDFLKKEIVNDDIIFRIERL